MMSSVQLAAVKSTVYTPSETNGIIALVFSGMASLSAVLALVVFMLARALFSWKERGGVLPQTHAAPYFLSLLLANTFQALGSVLNIRWINIAKTRYEPTCTAQGVLKNIGDVGTAVWSLVIAFHAFDVLFLRRKQFRTTVWATVIGTWSFILVVDLVGPVFIQKPRDGPFFGVSGYWCWITSNYPKSRIFLEYLWMFLSAFLCAVLHAVVFLRLRGNLSGNDFRSMRFRRIPRSERWAVNLARDEVDSRMYSVAGQLMWYPLVYIVVIIPIAVARFVNFEGHGVPFSVTVFTDFIFILNGLLNVIIFGVTYHKLPVTYLPTLATPRKSLNITNYGITPFILPSGIEFDDAAQAQIDLEKGTERAHAGATNIDKNGGRPESVVTVDSVITTDSTAPLTRSKHEH